MCQEEARTDSTPTPDDGRVSITHTAHIHGKPDWVNGIHAVLRAATTWLLCFRSGCSVWLTSWGLRSEWWMGDAWATTSRSGRRDFEQTSVRGSACMSRCSALGSAVSQCVAGRRSHHATCPGLQLGATARTLEQRAQFLTAL